MRLIEPLGLLDGPEAAAAIAAGNALSLAGGPLAFSLVRLLPAPGPCPVGDVPPDWTQALVRLTRPPAAVWLQRPSVMGVLNVTPDSFSDAGDHLDPARAIAAGLAMTAAGAAIIDVGGESTRPGAAPITPAAEQARILPVIRELARQRVMISVDTRNATTMAAAIDAGAALVNDTSALAHDPEAGPLLARAAVPVVLMHMRGTPAGMMAEARYRDVAVEVTMELASRLAFAERAGIARERILLDPGIGFAKTAEHNLELLSRLPVLLNLGCPLVLGVSRKRFIGRISGEAVPNRRLAGSLAAAMFGLARGAAILRVHDVSETIQALRIWQALAQAPLASLSFALAGG